MRYRQIKNAEGKYELVALGERVLLPRKVPYMFGDTKAYRPVAGREAEAFMSDPEHARLIDGRKQHREFLRSNNLTEVGDDSSFQPDNVFKLRGKTQENYDIHHGPRFHKGYDLQELAKETPVEWTSPEELK